MRNLAISLVVIVGVLQFASACGILGSSATDQDTLDALMEAGSDFTKEHPFDFYIYHMNKADAQRICAQLEAEGFLGTVREGALGDEWLCLARINFKPSIVRITEISAKIEALISEFGGEYDGWETIVIPK